MAADFAFQVAELLADGWQAHTDSFTKTEQLKKAAWESMQALCQVSADLRQLKSHAQSLFTD